MIPGEDIHLIDGAGMKFRAMREIGEDADISFIVLRDGGKVTHYFRGHEYSDGMGVWRDLYQVLYPNEERFIPKVPIVRTDNKPGFFKRLLFFFIHIWRQRPRNYQYKKEALPVAGRPKGFCYKVFSQEDTRWLNDYCKNEGVSLNALLLHSADKTFKSLLKESDTHNSTRVWMVPVNTRESFEQKKQWGNFVTTLSVYLNDKQSMKDLNNQMKSMLKSGIIWGGKWVANFPKYLGMERLRSMSKKDVKAPYVGLVSNLGAWGSSDNNVGATDGIFITPTVSKLAPVSIAAITWNGRLSLGWHLHPVLNVETSDLKLLCDMMITSMFSSCESIPKAESMEWSEVAEEVNLNP